MHLASLLTAIAKKKWSICFNLSARAGSAGVRRVVPAAVLERFSQFDTRSAECKLPAGEVFLTESQAIPTNSVAAMHRDVLQRTCIT